jgi:hypothetical protein
MTPSERIRHIRDIARELGQEEFPIIDLTLRQFGLPVDDRWNGNDRSTYVMDMTASASDGALLELAKHLGTASELEQVAHPYFWDPVDARVFISHVSAIKDKTAKLKDALAQFGITGFVAHADIEPTRKWQDEIEAALASMDALVALLSPGFNESKWCDQEVGVAVGRRVPIVPVRIELDPYGLFGKYQAIQGKGKNPSELAPLVFEALIQKPNIGLRITSTLVTTLRASPSWSESRRLMGLIEKSVFLTKEHVTLIERALAENPEVANSNGVPERIAALAQRVQRGRR